jgi:hypothetical protein
MAPLFFIYKPILKPKSRNEYLASVTKLPELGTVRLLILFFQV